MYRTRLLSRVFMLVGVSLSLAAAGHFAQTTATRITGVTLDRNKVILGCPPGQRPPDGAGCNDSLTVRVRAEVAGQGSPAAPLNTFVTGGRIKPVDNITFDWDLTGVMPGSYAITISPVAANGSLGESKTASVSVERCKCAYGDACPSLSVNGPSGMVRYPEPMTFVASVSGSSDQTAYNWTVSAGRIVSGQGTPVISVEIDQPISTNVTATVSIVDPSIVMACQTTASETASFVALDRPHAVMGDEFRTAGSNCEEGFARLDSFFVGLLNDPGASGVIIIYTDADEPNSGWKRKKQLMSYINQRHFDPSRITFLDGPLKKNAQTQFWLVPAGAERPQPEPGPMPMPHSASKPTKPYLFGAEHLDGIPGCDGNTYDPDAYAAELKSAPKQRGRVIISETSQARFAVKRREILSILTKNRVASNRVTFVFKKVRPRQLAESVELWIVPSP